MFIRSRGDRHQMIETYRECGRVRQRVVANLGPCGSVVEARWRLGTEASPIAGFHLTGGGLIIF